MQRADRLAVLGIALAFSSFFGHRAEGFVPHPVYAVTAGSLCILAVLNAVTAFTRIVWTMNQLGARSPVGPAQALSDRQPANMVRLPANHSDARFASSPERALRVER